MSTKTDIVNRALIKIGQPRISNIETESTPAAVTMNAIWDSVRDSLLQLYPWNFAVKRATLAAESAEPDTDEWNTQFILPVDFLQLLEVETAPPYSFEGSRILCNDVTGIKIKYVACIEDTSQYSALFCELLSNMLAYESVEKITQDKNLKQLLYTEQTILMNRALGVDAIENRPEDMPTDDWLIARL